MRPKVAYVPVTQPLKSAYEIGALYYPGWQSIEKWQHLAGRAGAQAGPGMV
jgi:hypothetical protein